MFDKGSRVVAVKYEGSTYLYLHLTLVNKWPAIPYPIQFSGIQPNLSSRDNTVATSDSTSVGWPSISLRHVCRGQVLGIS